MVFHSCKSNETVHKHQTKQIHFLPFRMLTREETMASLGLAGYDFHGLTLSQSTSLIGRGMAASSLSIVLIPVLKHLSYMRESV